MRGYQNRQQAMWNAYDIEPRTWPDRPLRAVKKLADDEKPADLALDHRTFTRNRERFHEHGLTTNPYDGQPPQVRLRALWQAQALIPS